MSDESRGLVKWKTALVVGVGAVALAGGALLAYYVLTRSRSLDTGEEDPSEAQSPRSTPTANVSVEGGSKSSTTTTSTQSTLERAQAIKLQGNEFYKQQKYDEAIKCYKEAISVCPVSKKNDLAIFYQNLAAAYDMKAQKTTDPDQKTSLIHQVLENCTKAYENNPRYIKAMTRRLKAYQALGMRKEALLDVTRVLVLDENQGVPLSQTIASLLKEFGKHEAKENYPKLEPLSPTKYLVKAYYQSFYWSDDLSESRLKELWSSRSKPKTVEQPELVREDGSEVITSDQSDMSDDTGFTDEPFVRAAAAFREAKYHGILELLTEAITDGNAVFVPHALLLRGGLNALWRQGDKALKDFQDVINMQGLSKEMYTNALLQRAALFSGSGENDKCQTCFDKALAIDPNSVDVFICRSRIRLESEETQDMGGVVKDLEKAQSLAPSSPQAAYVLASAYHRTASIQQSMQMLESARAKFEEAVQKFPNFGDGLLLYAMFLQDASQPKEAEEVINKAMKLEPENPIAHFSLGMIHLLVSLDVEKAIQHIETAITKDISCLQAYSTLATIEMQRGNVQRSLELYNKGIMYSRSEAEMAQAYISREVVMAQNQACKEYNVSPAQLANRVSGGSVGMH